MWYGMLLFLAATKLAGRAPDELHLNIPVENMDNSVRIRPLDHVGDPCGVVESLSPELPGDVSSLALLFGRETHVSTTQSDPLLLPTRNGPCREDGALHWEYLF